ncbi:hypothetical protein BST81_09960 [Leptolyngbya sp. 'hensonii']|nr:hypothetical protein BST81_09960 [Leptolyngbya sp. 'hensonii']
MMPAEVSPSVAPSTAHPGELPALGEEERSPSSAQPQKPDRFLNRFRQFTTTPSPTPEISPDTPDTETTESTAVGSTPTPKPAATQPSRSVEAALTGLKDKLKTVKVDNVLNRFRQSTPTPTPIPTISPEPSEIEPAEPALMEPRPTPEAARPNQSVEATLTGLREKLKAVKVDPMLNRFRRSPASPGINLDPAMPSPIAPSTAHEEETPSPETTLTVIEDSPEHESEDEARTIVPSPFMNQ